MRESSRGWMEKVTPRIGMGGVIDFTATAVGQTLHIPCRTGDHIVDFPIAAHLPPEVVVKKMLQAGWTVGNHPKCPDCSRSRQSKANSENSKKRWAGTTPEERSAYMKTLRAKAEKKDENMNEGLNATTSDNNATTKVSDAARKAHRLVMQCLEDYYDEQSKRYRPGRSDKGIAEETGASEASVKKTREEYFGPLGEPEELAELRSMMDKFQKDISGYVQLMNDGLGVIQRKMQRICEKNGWPVE